MLIVVAWYAVACAVAAVLVRLFGPKSGKEARIAFAAALAIAAAAATALLPWAVDHIKEFTAKTPSEKMAARAAAEFRSDPVMREWSRKASEADGGAAARAGLRRLSSQLLLRRMELVSRMFNRISNEACERLALSKMGQKELDLMLATLSDDEAADYARITAAATAAEVKGQPPPGKEPSEQDWLEFFSPLFQELPETDAARLESFLDGKASASDACWAKRLMYRKADALKEPMRSKVAAMLVWT